MQAACAHEPFMGYEERFLEAILAQPDDDAPRLIFADWLEEHGDPRGEFIRVQCDLATLPLDDRRRPELVERERMLLIEHKARWVQPVERLVEQGEFRRGFVEVVKMDAGAFLSQGDRLFRLAPIKEVQLVHTGFLLERLAFCPQLERVHTLSLVECRVGDEDVKTLAGSPHLGNLRGLVLWNNPISDAGARALALSAALGQLRALDLGRNAIGDAGAHSLAESPAMARLRSLDLAFNQIGPSGVRALAVSAYLRQLAWLDLRGNFVPDAAEKILLARFGHQRCRF